MEGGRRNHEERHPNSYIVVSSRIASPNSSQHASPSKLSGTQIGDVTPPSVSSVDLESDPSPNQSVKMQRQINSARRKLCMSVEIQSETVDICEENKSRAPMPIFVDDEDLVTSAEREAISDIGDSEVEYVARRYIIQTLNRTLMELYHACEVDNNLERCDHALSILQEAARSFQILRERMANQSHHEFLSTDVFEPSSCEVLLSDIFQPPTASRESPVETWCDVVRRNSKVQSNFDVMCKEPSIQRSLHAKLLSPDRHRRNPESVMKKHDEKQELAKRKREELEMQRQERLREADLQRQEKLRQLKEKRETEKISIDDRLKRAHELYQMRLMERQQKAGKESTKVSEVKQEIAFIDQLTAENKNIDLQTRMEMAEARRLQALETAAKAAERVTREASARQRRAAMEGAKIERIQARQAQKFGTAGEVLEITDADIRPQSARDDPRDRTTTAREEAARLRREQLEQERQRKVEQVAHEKVQRAEEHQRKILEERMKVLAAKEARLRHQAQLLDRMAKAMQADAQAQRECLQNRLEAVQHRKERYMAQIISRSHGNKSLSMHQLSESIAEDIPSCIEKGMAEVDDEKTKKARRKRAKKFKQRLAGIRSAWQEEENDSLSRPCSSSGRTSKLARYFSDVVKGAPASDQIENVSGKSKGSSTWPRQPCRDLEGMLRILQEVHRFTRADDADCKTFATREERAFHDTLIRKSGCLSALIRLLGSDEKFMFPKLHIATLKVLIDVIWTNSTNRLYLIVTGRLISLIDLLETALSVFPSNLDVELDSFSVTRLLIVAVSVCLDCQCDTPSHIQARDDTLGYLVHTEVVFRLEKMLNNVIRMVTNLCSSKSVESNETKMIRFSGFLNLLVSTLSLVESITKCQESTGLVKCSVKDESVISSLSSVLREARLVGLVPLLSALLLEINLCGDGPTTDSSREGEFPLGPQGKQLVLRCVVKSFQTLNNVAIWDRELVQSYLGSVVVCSEFSHIVLRILELFRIKNSNIVCEILHETVLLLGFLACSTAPGTCSPFTGWRNGVKMLQELCDLPVSYFTSPALREVIIPTLVVATYKNNSLLEAVANVVSPCLLSTYLKHCLSCTQNTGLDVRVLLSDGLSMSWNRFPPPNIAPKFYLANRFAFKEWSEASDWFSTWTAQESVKPEDFIGNET